MGINYYNPRPRYFTPNGKPLANGRLSFYYPDTTTLKEIYDEDDNPIANPSPLDSQGYVRDQGIYLGVGEYKVVLEKLTPAGYIPVWTIPKVSGDGSFNSGGSWEIIENIDALINIPTDSGVKYAQVLNYYTPNDVGGGYFIYDEFSTATPDGGSVIAPLGTPTQGRWIRQFDIDGVNCHQFGACSTSNSSMNTNMQLAETFVISNDQFKTLTIPNDEYLLTGDYTFSGKYTLVVQNGVIFTGASTYNVTIETTDAIVDGKTSLVDDNILLHFLPLSGRDAYIEWFGALSTYISDRTAFNRSDAIGRIIFSGEYTLEPTGTPVAINVDRVHFVRNTTIDIPGSYPVCTFNNYTIESDVENVFINGNVGSVAFSNKEVHIRMFENVLDDATIYEDYVKMICQDNTKEGTILFDQPKTYTSNVTYTDALYSVKCTFRNGAILKSNNAIFIGQVTNGGEHIFDNTSGNTPIMFGSYILQWWNPSEFDNTSLNINTVNAVKKAHSAQLNSNLFLGSYSYIDGLGSKFYVSSSISITNTGVTLFMKNCEFVVSNFSGGSFPETAFNIETVVDFDNMYFYLDTEGMYLSGDGNGVMKSCYLSNSESVDSVISVGIDSVGIVKYNGDFTMIDCTISTPNNDAVSSQFYAPDNLTLKNVTTSFSGSVHVIAVAGNTTIPNVRVDDCTFGNTIASLNNPQNIGKWHVTNTTFTGGRLNIKAAGDEPGATIIDNCIFNIATNSVNNERAIELNTNVSATLSNVTITNNKFNGGSIFLNSPGWHYKADGVVIKNNIFDIVNASPAEEWSTEIITIGSKNPTPGTDYGEYFDDVTGVGPSIRYYDVTGNGRCEVTANVCMNDALYVGTDQNYTALVLLGASTPEYVTLYNTQWDQGTAAVLQKDITEQILGAGLIPMTGGFWGSNGDTTTVSTDLGIRTGFNMIREPGSANAKAVYGLDLSDDQTNLQLKCYLEWNKASCVSNPSWIV